MTIKKEIEEILTDAIENDSTEVLLENFKLDPNILGKLSDEETLLHKAFARRKYQCSQHLILLGSNINFQDKFARTPIHYSCRSGFYEGANLLTLINCDLNIQDHKGRIPLMHAIKFKQMPLVKILMNRGSDSDIEDANGFNSLMWAIMHLSPSELKEMLSSSNEDQGAISEKIKKSLSSKTRKIDLKISNEILEESSREKSSNENSMEILPSYLLDVIKERVKAPEAMASYSITEHIESLKEKAKEEAFDYQRITTSEDNPGQIEYENGDLYTFENKPEKKQEVVADYSITVTNKNKDIEPQIIQQEIIKSSSEDVETLQVSKNDIQRVSSSNVEGVKTEKININQREVNQTTTGKIHVGEYNTESKNSEIQEIKHGEIDPKTLEQEQRSPQKKEALIENNDTGEKVIKGSKSDEIKKENWTGVGHVDHLKNEASHIKASGPETITKVEVQHIARPKGFANTAQTDIVKIKRLNSENKDEVEEKIKDDTKDSEKNPIITVKKNITYLKDGYRDEIKDEYGKIKTVDKNVEDDTLGVLKSGDRIIKDEYGEIKKVNKNIVPEIEASPLKPGVRSANTSDSSMISGKTQTTNNEKISITHKEIKTIPQEEIKRPKAYEHNEQEAQEIKRPSSKSAKSLEVDSIGSLDKLDRTISKRQMEEEIANYKISESSTAKDDNSAQRISSKKSPKEESDKQFVSGSSDVADEISAVEEETLNDIVDPNQKNAKGQTLAWISSEKGQIALLKKLILRGADYEVKDQKGVSCLMIASINGQNDIVDYLCHKVRNIDEKRTDGHTALSLAIENDNADVAKILIDNGAGVDTKIKGHSLLMHAASLGAIKSIKLLIMLGLNPLEKNFRGKNSLDLAKASKKKEAYMVLAKIVAARLKQAKGKA